MASISGTNVDVAGEFNVNVDEVEDADEDEDDSDFVEEEFPRDEDHTNFVKFVDDNVDAQEYVVLAGIRARNNQ